jgi:hypothetical protein
VGELGEREYAKQPDDETPLPEITHGTQKQVWPSDIHELTVESGSSSSLLSSTRSKVSPPM